MSINSYSPLRKEVECDLGFASRNEVRQRLRRTARQGPAERAVTGIEKQLAQPRAADDRHVDRKSTRLNSSHVRISYAVFCLKKKYLTFPNLSTRSTATIRKRHNGTSQSRA